MQVHIEKLNMRHNYRPIGSVIDIMKSYFEVGQLEPVSVKKEQGSNDRYIVLNGHRRCMAYQILWEHMEEDGMTPQAIIDTYDLLDEERDVLEEILHEFEKNFDEIGFDYKFVDCHEIEDSENDDLHRLVANENIKKAPFSAAVKVNELLKEGYTQKQLAEALGKTQSMISLMNSIVIEDEFYINFFQEKMLKKNDDADEFIEGYGGKEEHIPTYAGLQSVTKWYDTLNDESRKTTFRNLLIYIKEKGVRNKTEINRAIKKFTPRNESEEKKRFQPQKIAASFVKKINFTDVDPEEVRKQLQRELNTCATDMNLPFGFVLRKKNTGETDEM